MASMSDSSAPDAVPELVDRLRMIEEQPLGARAEAYAAVQDELARRLESAPTDTPAARRA
ncbi:hypothetical protein MMX123_03160 [Microbacterium sp. MM2322]|jgi:hypothetical protein|nr:hypothetical protein BJP65_11645 [Microbacterium sp. BH-3-3-3]KQR86925.1 hypothetical protein ASF96_11490 [Microbacterium sp. Leaf179]KQT70679.1 hypothetical protein ASG45_15655 [Microbacterium sp. Leaf436]